MVGPSPRMRGTRGVRHDALTTDRSIPAYAGNTDGAAGAATETAVHPRVCGEHLQVLSLGAALIGPSPRMRGTHWRRSSSLWWWTVHPRVCGEHGQTSPRTSRCPRSIPAYAGNTHAAQQPPPMTNGPSPRMRGTRRCCVSRSSNYRSIPAYAGNTSLKLMR